MFHISKTLVRLYEHLKEPTNKKFSPAAGFNWFTVCPLLFFATTPLVSSREVCQIEEVLKSISCEEVSRELIESIGKSVREDSHP